MFYHLILGILLLAGAYCAFQMSVADLRRRIIPDVYLFPFVILGLLVVTFFPWISSPSDSVIAAAFGYALGTIVGFVFEKFKKQKGEFSPIGMGDVKLLAAGGIWLGMTGLATAIAISCIIGGIWGLHKKQKYIPFAPFFFVGGILTLIALRFLI
ncbi:MAG: prepilin peptidase [Alphaproteobacteria bacterium]|nr:prepilin peptidase [Alphaproteobacteria bacterium]MBN2674977.1 prepilin peptidase [Alphaproteobacteria bacterium]